MKRSIVFFLLLQAGFLFAQTSTNSTGSGNFNSTATWTSPKDLTGTATILNGHTVTVPSAYTVYSNKITFTGSGKLALTTATSKWVPATNFNSSPPTESLNIQSNWTASTVFNNDAFSLVHNTPWIDSGQAWSAQASNNKTDYLQYDLISPRWVQGIVTQGRANSAQWVTSAKVDVSTDNINWATAASSLTLNSDQNTKKYNNFPNVMFARYVRVTPINVNGHASMRLGILLREQLFRSCKEILDNNASTVSGVYSIDPDGVTGAQLSTTCYCDMDTDGGGWTLVLNYLHKAYTYPTLLLKTKSLPLLASAELGNDESTSLNTWGHVAAAYLNSFAFTEVRFYGKTSGHARTMNFKTSHSGTISYFKTGSGNMSGIATSFTPLSGHNTNLPALAINFWSNMGDYAMTAFPFYSSTAPIVHWGIQYSNRWEMDDFPGDYRNSTLHQIWIR
jgi:hypothetical protein